MSIVCVGRIKIGILLITIVVQAQAYELSAVELEKLASAQRLAARVFQETKDAAGAVNVLEEAGVRRLGKGRPMNMNVKAYLDTLEAYAGYLARADGGDEAAASYLTTVLKQDPKRSSAYRSLGELYYKRFRTNSDPQYRRIYQRAFIRYVEEVLAQGDKVLLPQYISEAVYPQATNICLLVDMLKEQRRLSNLELLFGSERQLSQLDLSDSEGIHTRLGPSFKGFMQTAVGPITRSIIDIDNDGYNELRFYATTANGCQRNLFYKKYGEQTALLSNDLLDAYYRVDRICEQDSLQIIHFRNINYIIERKNPESELPDLQIYEIRPSGEYIQRCRLSPPTALQKNLEIDCQSPVCDHIAANIDKIVAADGQIGSEWLVTDVDSLKFAPDAAANTGLQPFISSEHQYLADLDNDGGKELISRLWQEQSGGKLEYQYRLFKLQNEQWQPWTLPSAVDAAAPGPWQWFFVEAFENNNYMIAYTATRVSEVNSSPTMHYKLTVYLLKQGRLTRVGELLTRQPVSVKDRAQ